ncbi:MAG: hypothetical protein AAGN46_09410 [Acidobacteriota bacterium]
MLASILLRDSGTYRYAASPPRGVLWPEADWDHTAKTLGKRWKTSICEGTEIDEDLRRRFEELVCSSSRSDTEDFKNLSQVEVAEIYSGSKLGENSKEWRACKNLLELLAIADEACRGLGVTTSPKQSQRRWYNFVSNFLLNSKGSLSRLPTYLGVVLPKMRTPQLGLTIRSLSHHLTFHRAEVDISWRAVPWLNVDENSLNILVIPWPLKIEARWFKKVDHPRIGEHLGPSRYFTYAPPEDPERTNQLVEHVARMMHDAQEQYAERIHCLVFPEASLSRSELRAIQKMLVNLRSSGGHVPFIVAGIHQDPLTNPRSSKTREPQQESCREPVTEPGAFRENKVAICFLYAGKWYEVLQDKHHRWKLDRSQVQQYKLGGVLAGDNSWWEAINLPKRQLTLISPNGWLTLATLVCEDLARLEPVSDIIRGVGPTILFALLMDGPQIRERWSARYANVLADDPGTSVLSVTSLGMSRRTRLPAADDRSDVVILWRDQISGWKEIAFGENGGAAVLSVSAQWHEEYSADIRTDNKNAAVFVLSGHHVINRSEEADPTSPSLRKAEPRVVQTEHSDPHDIVELSLWTHFVDQIIDGNVDFARQLRTWVVEGQDEPAADLPLQQELVDDCRKSLTSYSELVGRSLPTPELKLAMTAVEALVRRAQETEPVGEHEYAHPPIYDEDDRAYHSKLLEYWEHLVNEADAWVAEMSERSPNWASLIDEAARRQTSSGWGDATGKLRILEGTPQSVYWAVHNRLVKRKRFGKLSTRGATLLERIERRVERRAFRARSND